MRSNLRECSALKTTSLVVAYCDLFALYCDLFEVKYDLSRDALRIFGSYLFVGGSMILFDSGVGAGGGHYAFLDIL